MVSDEIRFSNISATTAAFSLKGGHYAVSCKGTWGGGSATLQILGPDNSTYMTAMTAVTADGISYAYLPAGTYKVAIATATAVYVEIKSMPL